MASVLGRPWRRCSGYPVVSRTNLLPSSGDARYQSVGVGSGPVLKFTGLTKLSGLWETEGMKKPELTDVGWPGPKDEMDRASHRFGKCSECHEIICVEKVVADTQNTQPETNEILYSAFRTHVKLKHGSNALHADVA
jgi:hypothetical protein